MSPAQTYSIPASPLHTAEFEVKRSQFITFVGPASNRDQAEAFIRDVRELHPQARHVCWAYIAGAPNTTVLSMSDDGEPSGTAGRPMLNVLRHSGLGEIVVAVVRYFGGIKLGTGGLQRAYSDAVTLGLDDLPTQLRIPRKSASLVFDYAQESLVRHLLEACDVLMQAPQYGARVTLEVEVASAEWQALKSRLINQTAGDIDISEENS
ncbi:MAG: YigZ family protein [Oceanospirillaceae bacterium]|nr:YigZ family protein [Oceanospirillaceae bacterium]